MSKSTGSYYTPQKLVAFMWKHALTNLQNQSPLRILEPSCGDGVFLQVLPEGKSFPNFSIDAIEINQSALRRAKQSLTQTSRTTKISFVENDFLKANLREGYDLVIGNPPYIGRKLLSTKQKKLCTQIQADAGLKKTIRNIWPAFVIKSSKLLGPKGVLAFVLPGEILQVAYAEEIRTYLEEHFSFIEILTFQDLVFPALGQDVVVVFAYKSSNFSGVSYAQVRDIDSLDFAIKFSPRKLNALARKAKWSSFVLSDDELDFLFNIAQNIKNVSDYCSSTPGIVTGANDFFIVNRQTLKDYGLRPFSKPILQKAALAGNTVSFGVSALVELQEADEPCFFIDLQDTAQTNLSSKAKAYLRMGRQKKIHSRYKCSNRRPWYNVPTVWIPHGVIFKRSHLYPRLLKNEAGVLFTDSAYRIIPNQGLNVDSIIYSFYNSLTLIFCELRGRFYGGGVLELTPSEFKGLPLPFMLINQQEFNRFKVKFKSSGTIDSVLKQNDIVLLASLRISQSDIRRLQDIRTRLLMRRLRNID